MRTPSTSGLRVRALRLPRALWLLALLGALSLLPAAVMAQEALPPAVTRLQVQVLPEYDDPRVLVIVQGRLSVTAEELPVQLVVRVPRGAQINQMAVMNISTGRTSSRVYEALPDPADERWSLVSYEVDDPHFFYEYYYNPIEGDPDKAFTFVFSSVQAVQELMIEIQQPLAATQFTTVPAPTVTRSDEGDFIYHQFPVSGLPADAETSVEVRYTKAGSEPSVSREQLLAQQQLEASGAQPAVAGAGTPTPAETPLWVWALLGGGMLAGGGVLWQRQQKLGTGTPAWLSGLARRGAAVPTAPTAEPAELAAAVPEEMLELRFCPKCGTAFKANARFCHGCGAPRQEAR